MALSYPPPTALESYPSSDRDESSSAEQSDESTSSEEEDEDEDDESATEENDMSSLEEETGGAISVENDDVHQATGDHRDEAVSDGVLFLRPGNERPNISFELAKNSSIADKLPGFLAQIRAANEELEAEKSAGTLSKRRIELDESDSANEAVDHIELNLALGVLEAKGNDASATSESDASNEDGDCSIMNKLLGCKRNKQLEDDDERSKKKAKIQEV